MLVKQYLKKHNLTQRSLALQLGCTTTFVNNLVRNKNTDIKISLLKKIHKATGIPYDKLVDGLLRGKNKVTKKATGFKSTEHQMTH